MRLATFRAIQRNRTATVREHGQQIPLRFHARIEQLQASEQDFTVLTDHRFRIAADIETDLGRCLAEDRLEDLPAGGAG